MQAVVADPTKSALIAAVAAGMALDGVLAAQAVARLNQVLPVYLASLPSLEQAALDFIDFMHGAKPMPDWYKHATQ
jgi:hypothetical protein